MSPEGRRSALAPGMTAPFWASRGLPHPPRAAGAEVAGTHLWAAIPGTTRRPPSCCLSRCRCDHTCGVWRVCVTPRALRGVCASTCLGTCSSGVAAGCVSGTECPGVCVVGGAGALTVTPQRAPGGPRATEGGSAPAGGSGAPVTLPLWSPHPHFCLETKPGRADQEAKWRPHSPGSPKAFIMRSSLPWLHPAPQISEPGRWSTATDHPPQELSASAFCPQTNLISAVSLSL